MKTVKKKLGLNKNTISSLNDSQLNQIAGGQVDTGGGPSGYCTDLTDCNCHSGNRTCHPVPNQCTSVRYCSALC